MRRNGYLRTHTKKKKKKIAVLKRGRKIVNSDMVDSEDCKNHTTGQSVLDLDGKQHKQTETFYKTTRL